jgi:hypothetical protein
MVQPIVGQKVKAQNIAICCGVNGSAISPPIRVSRPTISNGKDRTHNVILAGLGRVKTPAIPSRIIAVIIKVTLLIISFELLSHRTLLLNSTPYLPRKCSTLYNPGKCCTEVQTSSTDAFAGRFHGSASSESGRPIQSQFTHGR